MRLLPWMEFREAGLRGQPRSSTSLPQAMPAKSMSLDQHALGTSDLTSCQCSNPSLLVIIAWKVRILDLIQTRKTYLLLSG